MSKNNKLVIQVLVDNPNSWIIPYAKKLVEEIKKMGHSAEFVGLHDEVKKGDILFLLGCVKLFKKLNLNKHNLVVHESDLPQGKGWSPLTWQILEGKNEIPITLFEAVEDVDAGPYYLKDKVVFEGHELVNELREKQGLKTIELCLRFIKEYGKLKPIEQKGESTYYRRRTPLDSEIDINKSVNEQFNLFRVVDNERYPAFFWKNGKKYYLKIEKGDENE